MSNPHDITNRIDHRNWQVNLRSAYSICHTYFKPAVDLLNELTDNVWTSCVGLQEVREHAWLQGCSLLSQVLEAPLYEDVVTQKASVILVRCPITGIATTYAPTKAKQLQQSHCRKKSFGWLRTGETQPSS
jgi:hypothetical protein